VFADRNNHQKRERAQFIEDINKVVPDATFVALHYVHNDKNIETIRESLRARVLARGDNHQTIHANFDDLSTITGIMDGFIKRFEPLDRERYPDCDFDFVIDLDPLVPTRENFETVIAKLSDQYPKLFPKPEEMPTASDLDEAIEWAMNTYKPETYHMLNFKIKGSRHGGVSPNIQKKNIENDSPSLSSQNGKEAANKPKKQPKIEYFAVTLHANRITAILNAMFADLPPARAKLFRQLQQMNRVQKEFHVTLMHRAHASTHITTWAKYEAAYKDATSSTATSEADKQADGVMGKCGVQLERVVWDKRIMAFVVRLVPPEGEGSAEWESVNRVAHVTIGTAGPEVKPKESNDLLAKWLDGEEVDGLDEEKVKGQVILNGVVKAVLQRF
jgi:tRNA ligase